VSGELWTKVQEVQPCRRCLEIAEFRCCRVCAGTSLGAWDRQLGRCTLRRPSQRQPPRCRAQSQTRGTTCEQGAPAFSGARPLQQAEATHSDSAVLQQCATVILLTLGFWLP
jgi:hypothetical protein